MSVGAVDVRFRGYVFESAVAFVVVENILRARQPARAAHHGNALPDASGALAGRGSGGQIEVHVVRDHQIEFAVAVVIDECAARSPRFSRAGDAGFFGDLGEDAALVVIEAILSVISNVEIFPAVVVVVSDANALTPAGGGEPGFHGDIGESSVVIVAVEVIARSVARRAIRRAGCH